MIMRRRIVVALEAACTFLDGVRWLPWPLTRLRCPNGMALWSSNLDERWGTGVWEDVGRGPEKRLRR